MPRLLTRHSKKLSAVETSPAVRNYRKMNEECSAIKNE